MDEKTIEKKFEGIEREKKKNDLVVDLIGDIICLVALYVVAITSIIAGTIVSLKMDNTTPILACIGLAYCFLQFPAHFNLGFELEKTKVELNKLEKKWL